MSKIQQEKLDKIAAALDRLAADMKDVKKGVGVIKTNTPTDASINSTIKNYSFGRSLAALNVGFDLAELKVMLALFGFNNDYCSDMCKLAFFSFPLIHYNIFFLKSCGVLGQETCTSLTSRSVASLEAFRARV